MQFDQLKRREFVILLGGAATGAFAAHAQQTRVRRIGVLMGTAATKQYETYLAAFLRRLEELGWKKGQNTRIEVRWWTGGPEQTRSVAAELLASSPDVIMVYSNLALAVVKPMTQKVPIYLVKADSRIAAASAAQSTGLCLGKCSA
jgi:putative ABC transport system substrate-binding protein